MLCFFAAAYAFAVQLLLLEGNTAGGYAGIVLKLVLALAVAAPHSADKARLIIGDFLHFFEAVRVKCHIRPALKRLIVKTVVNRL